MVKFELLNCDVYNVLYECAMCWYLVMCLIRVQRCLEDIHSAMKQNYPLHSRHRLNLRAAQCHAHLGQFDAAIKGFLMSLLTAVLLGILQSIIFAGVSVINVITFVGKCFYHFVASLIGWLYIFYGFSILFNLMQFIASLFDWWIDLFYHLIDCTIDYSFCRIFISIKSPTVSAL